MPGMMSISGAPLTLARKKAEKEALLAAEEASLPSKPKSAPKAGSKSKSSSSKNNNNIGSGMVIPPGGGVAMFNLDDPLNLRRNRDADGGGDGPDELSATGLEQMIEAMELINQKTDNESLGAKVGCVITTVGSLRLSMCN
jgi:hypothetical protein